MKPSSNTSPPGSENTDASQSASRAYTPGLSDGLGDRLMMFDTASQSSLELLRFKREFSDAPGFEEAVRSRVEELSRFKHASIAPVRGIQAVDDGIALVSTNTAGRRLSEMVHVARGAPFAMDLIQQLAPALAALHAQGSRVAHGLLTAERIIITREGRLIVVEHVLASAFEQLRLPSTRLRTEFGIAVPTGSDPVALNQRSDVVQLGFLALSLLLGRRLDPAHYPANMTTLLDEFTHADAASSAKLRPWLERALQMGDKAFASAQEAHKAFASPAGESQVTISKPAPAEPATASQSQVLAFRPADGGALATGRSKSESSKNDARSESAGRKDSTDPAKATTPPIGLQKLESTPPPMPVASIASPRAKSGSTKWIAIAGAAALVIAGGLYAAGAFSGSKSPSSPVTSSPVTPPTNTTAKPATPPPTATEPAPVPLPPPPGVTPGPAGLRASGPASTPNVPVSPAPAPPAVKDPVNPPASKAKDESAPAERPAPAVGGIGGVRVSAPVDLQVYENGVLMGSTAGQIAMLAGQHTLELVNESLAFRVRSIVTVKGGQLTPLNVNLPNGKISINAVPWAEVTIDGKPYGQTPLANLTVQIGQHRIVFRHPDFGEQEQTVIVKADGLARASVTFKK